MVEEIEEEKLEFLKREEIRTMQKDIAALREIEAQKERERVAEIKTEEKIQLPSKVGPEEALPAEAALIPKPPRRPHPLRKALIRMALSLLLVFLIGFFYWFFVHKEKLSEELPSPEKMPPAEEQILPEEEIPSEETVQAPEIPVSLSLIAVNSTSTREISGKEEVPNILEQLIQEELEIDSFVRVVIKNIQENKILGLADFFEALSIASPEGISQKLENDFTLFIYTQPEGKRIGFVTKIKEGGGLENLLSSWEATMATDFGNLLKIMEGAGVPAFPSFRTATHLGTSFRYQDFSIPHFGLCYSILDQYFVFTSSGESIIKVIEQLK
jgi:hypothetical protein